MSDLGRFQDDADRAADLPDLTPVRAGRNGNAPPKEYQFKKGQSGNPAGAPKRVFSSLIHAYLSMDDQKMARKFIRQLYEQACKGNRTAIRVIISRLDRLDCLPEDALLEPSDIEAHAKAFQAERKEARRSGPPHLREFATVIIPDNGRDPELTKLYREQQEQARQEREQ